MNASEVRSRLEAVRARVAAAAVAAGRAPASVRIVAVTKRLGVEAVRAAYAAGQRDFGENYVQEATRKIGELSREMPDARWHLVGRLQSNKAAAAVRAFSLLHGIDSVSTAAAVARAAARDGGTADVLLQVRLGERGGAAGTVDAARDESAARSTEAGGDSTTPAGAGADATTAGAARAGIEADAAEEFLRASAALEGLRIVGLMGVADPDLAARPQFAALRELAVRLRMLGLERAPLGELSMGMTGDFEDAIAEGATIVRIGTAIFGERPVARKD